MGEKVRLDSPRWKAYTRGDPPLSEEKEMADRVRDYVKEEPEEGSKCNGNKNNNNSFKRQYFKQKNFQTKQNFLQDT